MRRLVLTRLWLGQFLSAIGDELHQVALMWIAVEAVGGRAGLVAVAGTVARLLVGPAAGVYADRQDRRRTMIAADVGRAIAVATLPLADVYGGITLVHLAAVAAVLGALDSLFAPALQGSLPTLAPEPRVLQRANALLNVNHRAARIVGPGLTGALLALVPIAGFFSINAATFAASAIAVATLGRGWAWRATDPAAARPRLRDELRGTLRLVRGHPYLLWGLGLIGVWNVGSAIALTVGLPMFAREVLQAGPGTYGLLMAGYGVGNVASNLLLAARPPTHYARALFSGGAVFGVCMTAFAWTGSLGAAVGLAACAAIGGPMTDLVLLMVIQTHFPSDQIGKVFSLRVLVSHGFRGVGLLAAAPLYAVTGVRTAMTLGALLVLAYALLALARHGTSRGDGREPGPRV